jgi:hypothetical protein
MIEIEKEKDEGFGSVVSTKCSTCGRFLATLQVELTNDQAERSMGHSGARHFCAACWVEKKEEMRLLARQLYVDGVRIRESLD